MFNVFTAAIFRWSVRQALVAVAVLIANTKAQSHGAVACGMWGGAKPGGGVCARPLGP